MLKLKAGILANKTYRDLIGRVLQENFRHYVWRYLGAFVLMGFAAAASGGADDLALQRHEAMRRSRLGPAGMRRVRCRRRRVVAVSV